MNKIQFSPTNAKVILAHLPQRIQEALVAHAH